MGRPDSRLRYSLSFALAASLAAVACTRGAGGTMAEFPSTLPGTQLAVILTGDDGITAIIDTLAQALADDGIPSVVVTPSAASESPDAAGAAIDRVARVHLAHWGRERLLLLGTARGASIAPFVANRLSDDLRDRMDALVLTGLRSRVSFRRQWPEPWRQTPRPTDLPVLPELERLRGHPILCLYRESDGDTFCPSLDPTLAHRDRIPVHRAGVSDGAALAARVARFVPAAARTP